MADLLKTVERAAATNILLAEDYLSRNLLAPAGLTQTGYVRPTWTPEDLVVGRKGDGTDGPTYKVAAV